VTANPELLIIFVALTTIAVLIQTGIAVGLYLATLKLSQQADRALAYSRRLIEPTRGMIDRLESTSVQAAEFSAQSQGRLRQLALHVDRLMDRALHRVRRPAA